MFAGFLATLVPVPFRVPNFTLLDGGAGELLDAQLQLAPDLLSRKAQALPRLSNGFVSKPGPQIPKSDLCQDRM